MSSPIKQRRGLVAYSAQSGISSSLAALDWKPRVRYNGKEARCVGPPNILKRCNGGQSPYHLSCEFWPNRITRITYSEMGQTSKKKEVFDWRVNRLVDDIKWELDLTSIGKNVETHHVLSIVYLKSFQVWRQMNDLRQIILRDSPETSKKWHMANYVDGGWV